MGKVKAAKAIKEMGRSSRKVSREGHEKSQKIQKDLLKEKQRRAAELARKRAARKRIAARETAKGPKPMLPLKGGRNPAAARTSTKDTRVHLGAGAPKTKAMRKQAGRRKYLYGY